MLHGHKNILLSRHIRVEKSPNYPVIGFSRWIIVWYILLYATNMSKVLLHHKKIFFNL